MADSNLLYKNVSIAAEEVTTDWTTITPGAGPMVLRATGSFRMASSATPGDDYMVVPSGVAVDYDSSSPVYVSMPKAGIVQSLKYS